MSLIVATVCGVFDPTLRQDDGRVDRLSHRYTGAMLTVFSLLVSTSQYVSNPIECWGPVHFLDEHVAYANDYCWVSGTFHIPFNNSILPSTSVRNSIDRSNYYQWVPVILLVQAALFNLPCLIWRSLVDRSGIDVNSLSITAQMLSTVQMTKSIRDGLLQRMVLQIDRYINSFHEPTLSLTVSLKHLFSRTCCVLCGHRRGNYLLALFVTTKVLYLLNAVGQLFALNLFLGQGYYLYGVEVIRAALRGEDWTGSYRFPRVNLCDFKVRRMGNIHQHTLQCVLPINLFNEKIFLFLWFWLVFLVLVTLVDMLVWTVKSCSALARTRLVKRYLMLAQDISVDDEEDKKRQAVIFTEKYLCQDGVFLLRLLQESANCITAMELTSKLWNSYLQSSSSSSPDTTSPTDSTSPLPLPEGRGRPIRLRFPWRPRASPKVPSAPNEYEIFSNISPRREIKPHPKELEALYEN